MAKNENPFDLGSGEFARKMKSIAGDLWGNDVSELMRDPIGKITRQLLNEKEAPIVCEPVDEGTLEEQKPAGDFAQKTQSGAGEKPAQQKTTTVAEDGKAPHGTEGSAAEGQSMWRRSEECETAARPKAARVSVEKAEAAPETDGKKLEALLIAVDDTIDWTEALTQAAPSDGLTPEKQWAFCRRLAPSVLKGNLDAYAEVLTTLNPLADMADFTGGIRIRTVNADRLDVIFEVDSAWYRAFEKRYLDILAIRMARDLLCCLPVTEVGITAKQKEETLLERKLTLDRLRSLPVARAELQQWMEM